MEWKIHMLWLSEGDSTSFEHFCYISVYWSRACSRTYCLRSKCCWILYHLGSGDNLKIMWRNCIERNWTGQILHFIVWIFYNKIQLISHFIRYTPNWRKWKFEKQVALNRMGSIIFIPFHSFFIKWNNGI